MRLPRLLLLGLALSLLPAACSRDDGTSAAGSTATTAAPATTPPPTTTTTIALSDDPTVVPDPLPPGEPGDLLAVAPRRSADVPAGARAWDVLYLSDGVGGAPVAVSGVVLAPSAPAPAGGRPVLSWAHGTTGVADVCAPSRAGLQVPYLEDVLAAGYVVAATDYEGLGTPGTHPYLVGVSEGRSVLDAARAAHNLEEAEASRQVMVLGHSQGGHAALFAGELAGDYAPDLDLAGVVAGAPVGELSLLMGAASAIGPGAPFLALLVSAYADAYGDTDPAAVFSPVGVELLGRVDEACLGDVADAIASRPLSEIVRASPLADPAWAARLRENEPGARAAAAPVLVVQGESDLLVPAFTTDTTVTRLCGAGTNVVYRRYGGADHTGVVGPAKADVLAFVADRLQGAPAPAGCPA